MSRNVMIGVACVSCLLIGLAIGFNLSKGNMRQTAISWKYGDAELVIDLDQDLADDESLLNKMFSQRFSTAGVVDWLKTTKRIYPFEDEGLINEFEDIEYDSRMAKNLRELSLLRKGPWAYQSDTISIGIPENPPSKGTCYVCADGKYRGKTIKLFDVDDPRQEITVVAVGQYGCPENLRAPDIQLRKSDAIKLLGYSSFNTYENAIALIVLD